MHYKIGVACVFNGITSMDNLVHVFNKLANHVMNSRVSGRCSYTILVNIPVMKGHKSFFKLFNLRPFITRTS